MSDRKTRISQDGSNATTKSGRGNLNPVKGQKCHEESPHRQNSLERSVGWSVALRPGSPDARQNRSPGRSNKSLGSRRRCLVDGRNPEVHGLVDGAVSPEEPVMAHKPDQRKQVSTRVSTVSMTDQEHTRPTQAHEQNHPQGVLDTRPTMANKQNDPHGLLGIRPAMACKQNDPLGPLGTRLEMEHKQNDPHGLLGIRPKTACKQKDPHGSLETRTDTVNRQSVPHGPLETRPIKAHTQNVTRRSPTTTKGPKQANETGPPTGNQEKSVRQDGELF